MKIRDIKPYGVRMQPELREKLKVLAGKNQRSINSEIVFRLMESIGREAHKVEAQTAPTV